LEDAIAHCHFDVIRLLLLHQASLGDRDKVSIAQALCAAATVGHTHLLKAYKLAGASLDSQDPTGRTPLHMVRHYQVFRGFIYLCL